jgi:hypothetical protein
MPIKIVEDKLKINRHYRFTKALGEDFPNEDILLLIESEVDYHDLEKLLKRGCSKELSIKILL